MRASKFVWLGTFGLVIAFVVAGCGGGAGYGGGGSPANNPAGAAVVKTASVSVKGTMETVLTDGQGKTLYFFDPDSVSQATCTGSCAQNWPALLTKNGLPAAPSGVTGTFGIVNGSNGVQVEYNGHPLYTYNGDSGPGQANGDGVLGKWHVATPSTPQNPNNSGGGNTGY